MPRVVPIVPPAPEKPETQEPPLVASTIEEPVCRPMPFPEHTQPAEAVGPCRLKPPGCMMRLSFSVKRSIVEQVCYVVDCSGSMYGRMYLVKNSLSSRY